MEVPILTGQQLAGWHSILGMCDGLIPMLDRGMLESDGTSIHEYALLYHLQSVTPEGLRMSDLAKSLLITSRTVNRRIDSLEDRGWVTRSNTDGGRFIVITEEGSRSFYRLADGHYRRVQDLVYGSIPPQDLEVTLRGFAAIAARVGRDPTKLE